MKLLIATTNAGKRNELSELLKELHCEIVSPLDLALNLEVEENGDTYTENALLKARTFCLASGLVTLADDTGLEVDALGGRPGVHSARYVNKPGATDADRRSRLLQELQEFEKPWKAHFHCSVALAAPRVEPQIFEGDVFGEITPEERGDFGFGYDRIFYIPAAEKTLAELTLEEKNEFSHRAIAVKKAILYLKSQNFLSTDN
jgi:XTP/dITP diphosphohydrolase